MRKYVRLFFAARKHFLSAGALTAALMFFSACGRLQVSVATPATLPAVRPEGNVARVIFVRPRTGGAKIAFSVWEGGTLLAYLRGAQMTYVDLSAGKHVFLGVAGAADVLEADLLPGKTYIVHCRFNSYYMGHSAHLDPLYVGHENWVFADEWLKTSAMTTLIPEEAAIWTERNASDNDERMGRYASRAPEKKKFILPEYGF